MAKAGNKYADKIFSEHPIALWPLDEQAYYLSQIDDNDRLFSNWTSSGNDRVNLVINPNFEVDTSNWSSIATSGTPTLARITSDKKVGTASLEVTKGTGRTEVFINANASVGLTYTVSGYIKVPSGQESMVAGARVLFLDSASTVLGTFIAGTTQTITSASGWTRFSATGTAPASTAFVRVYLGQQASATAGQKFLVDAAMIEVGSTLGNYFDGSNNGGAWMGSANASASVIHTKARANLVPNPNFETNVTGWASQNSSSFVRSTAQFFNGTASGLFTANGGVNAGPYYATRLPITAGKTYTLSAYVRDINTAQQFLAQIQWWTAASGGTNISNSTSSAFTVTSTGWTRVSVTGIAPATATHVLVWIATVGTPTNGTQAYVDAYLFEESPTPYPYFDGSITSISYGGTAYTIAPTWSGTAHASTSILANYTTSNSPTWNTSDPPVGTIMSSAIKSTRIPGSIELESPELLSALTISPDFTTFNINMFLYMKPSYINWFRVGYRYSNASGVPQEVISEEIPKPTAEGWANYNKSFSLPTSWSTGIKVFIQVNFMDTTGATADDMSFILGGFSVAQGSETTCFESLGVNAITLPAGVGLSGYQGYPIDQYGLSAENGYYLIKNNSLLARNDGFPIIYGTDHSTKLYPTLYGFPSLVFPGKGMLHENGRNKYYTMEMWLKIDPLTTTAQKIIGPLDSNDGIYVKEGFMTLVIGDEIASYCVAEWYRPMLLHLVLKEANATLMINGEEVVSLPFDRSSVVLSNLRDWWGLFTYDTVSAFYVDTISIFPYIVSNAVAKRRFVYGQGTPSAESLDTAYYGTPTQIDFSVSEYSNSIIYPDVARWDAGYFNNLIATKDYISTPNYSLPVINLGGRDLQEWYDNNYTINTSEYPDGQHPKFISFRPNTVTRTNLVVNPSMEVDTAGWLTMGGTLTRSTTDKYIGTASMSLSYTGTGTVGAQTAVANRINIVAGRQYAFSFYVKQSAATGSFSANIMWLNDAGSTVLDDTHINVTAPTVWTRYSQVRTAPAGATKAVVRIYKTSGESGGASAATVYFDAVLFEEASTVMAYFDGSYYDTSLRPVSYGWTGTAHASTSTLSYWNSDGINYTAPSYLNFPSLNVLNDSVSAVYGVFEAEKNLATDRTLMSFVNVVNGSEFNITLNADEITYSIKGAQDTVATDLYTEIITIGTETMVGLNFDEAGLHFGYDVSQFFSSPSSIQLFVGGNGVNTFEGKIYLVGFCNSNNYSLIDQHFYTSADITESTPSNAVERLAQGFVKSADFNFLFDHIASYTLLPEYEYGHLFLDISVSSEWEEYFPLTYFASYVKDENGELVYDLDLLQLNIGYTSIISTDVWTYYDITQTYPTYAALNAGPFANYFALQKNNTTGDTIDVSQSAIQSYVTFQPLASGANAPLSEFVYGVAIDANTLLIDADGVNTSAVPDKAYQTVFSFRDNTIVFPPKSKPFEDYAMVVHLIINQRSIIKNPLKIRRLEIASKNFSYNAADGTGVNKTQVGTRFGKKIYPQSDVYGGTIDTKWKNPYVIYKQGTPYIFTTKSSGIRPSRETYTSTSQPTGNEVFVPINESGAFVYKIAAMQFMVKPQFREETASVKLMEIRHRDGSLAFIADKVGNRAVVNVYSRSEATLVDGGASSTTSPSFFGGYDGGAPDSYYTQYFDIQNGPYVIIGPTSSEYSAVSGTEFYQNGRYVGTLTLTNNEWSAVGISLPYELIFDEYEDGGMALYGGFTFNNVSFYQSDGLGIESTIIGRTWNGIVSDQAPAGTPPNIWQYWNGSTWEYAYVLGTDIDFSSTPEDIYDAYMGTNSLLVDDGLKVSMKQKEVMLVTDASWSMYSDKPA